MVSIILFLFIWRIYFSLPLRNSPRAYSSTYNKFWPLTILNFQILVVTPHPRACDRRRWCTTPHRCKPTTIPQPDISIPHNHYSKIYIRMHKLDSSKWINTRYHFSFKKIGECLNTALLRLYTNDLKFIIPSFQCAPTMCRTHRPILNYITYPITEHARMTKT